MRENHIKHLLVVLLITLGSSSVMAERIYETGFDDLDGWTQYNGGYTLASRTGRSVIFNADPSQDGMIERSDITPVDVSLGTLNINFHMQWNAAGAYGNISYWNFSASETGSAGELASVQLFLRNDPGTTEFKVFLWNDSGGMDQVVNETTVTAFPGTMSNVRLERTTDGTWGLYASGNSPSIAVFSNVTESTVATGSYLDKFSLKDYPVSVTEPRYYNEMYIDGVAAVPEPATLGLLCVGTMFWAAKRRKIN